MKADGTMTRDSSWRRWAGWGNAPLDLDLAGHGPSEWEQRAARHCTVPGPRALSGRYVPCSQEPVPTDPPPCHLSSKV